MTTKTVLQAVVTFEQPCNANAATIDAAVDACYRPLLDAIAERSGARVAVSFTGHLLDHLARHHDNFMTKLRGLHRAGQVEILGGLFYGGAPAMLPATDISGQIEMMAQFWESYAGVVPRGFWLQELAWSRELPRLFEDTELEYGFISGTQIVSAEAQHSGLGVVQAGNTTLCAFEIDWKRSQSMLREPVESWVADLCDATTTGGVSQAATDSPPPPRVTTVWGRAESMFAGAGQTAEKFGQWLDAMSGGHPGIEWVLPAEAFSRARPSTRFFIEEGCAPELGIYGPHAGSIHWWDFPRHFDEVDTLHRRMLHASDKLSDAIATMEDEELEDSWSDALATAQRLVFSSQSVEGFSRGRLPGFSEADVRESTLRKIISATNHIDRLIQGEEDWIASEEQDLDGDGVDEVLVSTRHMQAWVVPVHGGVVRTLDDRGRERNILDAGTRRQEPFFAAMAKAPVGDQAAVTNAQLPGARIVLDQVRAEAVLPKQPEPFAGRGIRTRAFDAGTSVEELCSGSGTELLGPQMRWQVVDNGIDEEADCSYRFATETTASLEGPRNRVLKLKNRVEMPIDRPELVVGFEAELQSELAAEVLLTTEIPLRLRSGKGRLFIDEAEQEQCESQYSDVRVVRLVSDDGDDGEILEVRTDAPCDLWLMPVKVTVRDEALYRATDQGIVLFFVTHLVDSAKRELTVCACGQ